MNPIRKKKFTYRIVLDEDGMVTSAADLRCTTPPPPGYVPQVGDPRFIFASANGGKAERRRRRRRQRRRERQQESTSTPTLPEEGEEEEEPQTEEERAKELELVYEQTPFGLRGLQQMLDVIYLRLKQKSSSYQITDDKLKTLRRDIWNLGKSAMDYHRWYMDPTHRILHRAMSSRAIDLALFRTEEIFSRLFPATDVAKIIDFMQSFNPRFPPNGEGGGEELSRRWRRARELFFPALWKALIPWMKLAGRVESKLFESSKVAVHLMTYYRLVGEVAESGSPRDIAVEMAETLKLGTLGVFRAMRTVRSNLNDVWSTLRHDEGLRGGLGTDDPRFSVGRLLRFVVAILSTRGVKGIMPLAPASNILAKLMRLRAQLRGLYEPVTYYGNEALVTETERYSATSLQESRSLGDHRLSLLHTFEFVYLYPRWIERPGAIKSLQHARRVFWKGALLLVEIAAGTHPESRTEPRPNAWELAVAAYVALWLEVLSILVPLQDPVDVMASPKLLSMFQRAFLDPKFDPTKSVV